MADNAADVADDYRQALEDLTVNSRIEIATLTNIARENASYGHAIAEVLQNHIKKVPPSKTLPALYVLDSIVKNVPTPYALYIGPKLYSIFMGAYTKVDNATRRKMDEMLKTWKEPVPGSISTKPVFPLEQVRPIENALVAARNAAFAANNYQGQQQLLRGRQTAPSRETPTPPTGREYQPPPQQPPYAGPNGHRPDAAPQQPYPMHHNNGSTAIPHRATPQPAPSAGPYPPYQQPSGPVYGAPQPGISIDKLKDDIQQLIIAEKTEFAQDPLDTSKQTRLKALLDLQTIIQSQDMPQDQLMIIRDRVAELAVNIRRQPQLPVTAAGGHSAVTAPPSTGGYPGVGIPYTHTPTPPVMSQQPTPVPPSAAAVVAAALGRPPSTAAVAPPPATRGPSIDSLFGQGALAALLAGTRNSATPQPTPTPQPPPAAAPAPVLGPAAAAAIAAALRSPTPQTAIPVAAAPPPPPASNPSALLAMLRQSGLIGAGATPTPPPASFPGLPGMGGFQSLAGAMVDRNVLQLTTASLKVFRPYLIPQLYEDLGPPCTQCGRRFKTDDEGRRKKTAHMDWHFRVHQRMTDAEKRGQHRSWYVDELQQQDPLPPVPEDASRVNNTCPICQEKFEMKWLDEAQEWVWMDAVRGMRMMKLAV
ncbi:mRNA 3' end processing factor [Collariella sp. IMI 366227]|nr:mRNA 3' end processing factor [Collariella sp. IMI 366227]